METGMSIAANVWHFANAKFRHEGVEVDKALHIVGVEGSILPDVRMRLITTAMKWEATHIFMVDSDMVFPQDTLVRLLLHGKHVVGCNYPRRKIPCLPTAYSADRKGPCFTNPDSGGLEEVSHIGTGMILLDTRVLDAFCEYVDLPWFCFEPQIDPEAKDVSGIRTKGEDVYFCHKIAELGIPMYIDHDLSKEVGHVGKLVFTHQLVTEETNAKYQRKDGGDHDVRGATDGPRQLAEPVGSNEPDSRVHRIGGGEVQS